MALNPKIDVWKFFDNKLEKGYAVCNICQQQLKNDRVYCLRQHLRNVHSTKSDAMKYFKYFPGKGGSECRFCKQLVKNNRSFNLERHAAKCHNADIRYFKEPVFINMLEARENDLGLTDMDSLLSSLGYESIDKLVGETKGCERTSAEQSVETEKDAAMNKEFLCILMDKETIQSAVWSLMIEEGVAPTIFGSKNMQSLTKPICDALSKFENKEYKINSEESERILVSVSNQLRVDFSNEFHGRLLSLKIDMDLRGPEKTYCVSTAFAHKGKIQRRILGVIELEDDPQLTGQHIREVLNKYKVESNQIIYACWDDTKSKFNTNVSNSEYLQEIAKFEYHPKIYFNDIKLERYGGVLAHLCLLDIFKNPEIFELFSHCRNLVKFISNEENGLVTVLKQNKLAVPQLDSPWQWGSTYKMIEDLSKVQKIIDTKINAKMEIVENQFVINVHFWLFVSAFCESLRPIQKAIQMFYSEEMHFGDCYAQWLKTKMMTERISPKLILTNKYAKLLTSEALKCIETRTKEFLAIDAVPACLYMDPRYHHTLSRDKKSIAIEFLTKLWKKSVICNPANNNTVGESTPENMHLLELNENDVLNEFLCQGLSETKCSSVGVYRKIEQLKLPFEAVDTYILKFWENHKRAEPEIARLSEICFAIPATQNYNQIRYTHIYKIQPNRKLPQSTMDDLATIRLNPHLVDDVSKWFAINEDNTNLDDDRAD